MRHFAFTLFVLAAGLLAGCKGPCRSLSEKLCQCEVSTRERDICLRRVAASEANYSPDSAAEAVCSSLISKCDCTRLESTDPATAAQAKRDCGLSR
jgi:hypothetical protein